MSKTRRILLGLALIGAVGLGALHSFAAETRHADMAAAGRIISVSREDNRAMRHLDHLVNDIGSRPVDSVASLRAYKWARNELSKFGLENVHIERCGETEGNFSGRREADKFRRLHRSLFGEKPDGDLVPICNVVADIPGGDLPHEYVIVGAHIDTSPVGAGAGDNGTGVAAVIEAARILVDAGVEPRRTIRFVLFGGEEVGLVGSKGYLEAHPEIASRISAVYNMDHGSNYISGVKATAPMMEDMRKAFSAAARLAPDMPFAVDAVEYLPSGDPNCCASMVQKINDEQGMRRVEVPWGEGGAGACGTGGTARSSCGAGGDPTGETGVIVKTINADGDTVVRHVVVPGAACGGGGLNLEDLDLEALGISLGEMDAGDGRVKKAVAIGSSDHAAFLAAGIPAFWWNQTVDESAPYYAHTSEDTYDKVNARFLEHSAAVIALGAFGTANLDHMVSREVLAGPAGEGGRVVSQSACGSSCGSVPKKPKTKAIEL